MSDSSGESYDWFEEPPHVRSWTYKPATDSEIPLVWATFKNGWRLEIKPVDGQTFYSLAPPLDELDEWADDATVEGWALASFESVIDDLLHQLHSNDSLHKISANTPVVDEFRMLFEMLERENL